MVHLRFREHSKVLNLRFTKRRTIWGYKNQFGLSRSERLQSLLVSKNGLSWLHHKLDSGVHWLNGLLLLIMKKGNWVRERTKKGTTRVVVLTLALDLTVFQSRQWWHNWKILKRLVSLPCLETISQQSDHPCSSRHPSRAGSDWTDAPSGVETYRFLGWRHLGERVFSPALPQQSSRTFR